MAAGPRNGAGSAGHKQGARTFREIVRYCRSIGIRYLTVYAFSTENWKRPQSEINAIMNLLRDYLDELERHSDEEQGVLRFIGDMAPLAEDLRQRITDVQSTRRTGRASLSIALNYGGRHRMVHVVQQAVSLARQGTLTPEAVDEALVDSLMYTAGQPPVDLIIRPSGEQRISNFLLWQGAYAEFVFMDVLWPDFTPGRSGSGHSGISAAKPAFWRDFILKQRIITACVGLCVLAVVLAKFNTWALNLAVSVISLLGCG